jgi:leucyl aminopeptidase (aminopeptidase T)
MPSPAYITNLLAGARNLAGYANLAPGEQVVLVVGAQIDTVISQAVLAALHERDVQVTQIVLPQAPDIFFEPPSPVMEAMAAADTVIDLGSAVWGHTWATFVSMTEYLTKGIKVSPPADADTFTSDAAVYPMDLLHAIELRLYEMLQQPDGTPFEITSPGGTRLKGEVWRNRTGQGWGVTAGLLPGDFLMWPPGVVGFLPPKQLEGVAVFESFTGYGKTSEPVSYTIENQRIVRVDGGWEADEIRAAIKAADNGNFAAEIMFGVNPRSRVDLNRRPEVPLEAERTPQTLHVGIGDEKLAGAPLRATKPDGTTFHTDGMMIYPTLTVGSSVVLANGRLPFLEEDAFRALASEFGDPDRLLGYPAVQGYRTP